MDTQQETRDLLRYNNLLNIVADLSLQTLLLLLTGYTVIADSRQSFLTFKPRPRRNEPTSFPWHMGNNGKPVPVGAKIHGSFTDAELAFNTLVHILMHHNLLFKIAYPGRDLAKYRDRRPERNNPEYYHGGIGRGRELTVYVDYRNSTVTPKGRLIRPATPVNFADLLTEATNFLHAAGVLPGFAPIGNQALSPYFYGRIELIPDILSNKYAAYHFHTEDIKQYRLLVEKKQHRQLTPEERASLEQLEYSSRYIPIAHIMQQSISPENWPNPFSELPDMWQDISTTLHQNQPENLPPAKEWPCPIVQVLDDKIRQLEQRITDISQAWCCHSNRSRTFRRQIEGLTLFKSILVSTMSHLQTKYPRAMTGDNKQTARYIRELSDNIIQERAGYIETPTAGVTQSAAIVTACNDILTNLETIIDNYHPRYRALLAPDNGNAGLQITSG